jgi:LDH2 family malate/lactate/ureidoglycolate dehydrogenase
MSPVPAQALREFVESAYGAVGISGPEARTIAALQVEADLRGADGHGVFRLPQYIRRIKAGAVNVKPQIHIRRERAGTALVEGDNGMGHLVMSFAARTAIAKAKVAGIGWAGARMSNHAGPAALYSMMPLKAGMIGLYLAVGNANHLAPWGGLDMLLSTNPIAVAVPSRDEPPIVLDMATTVAAYGKVKTAAQRGESMPVGWMIDREGRPLTDPKRANEGLLLPLGGMEAGFKGYGLSLVFGLLAGTLNGAAMGRDVIDFNNDDTSVTNTGHAVVAIDPEAFGDAAQFRSNVDALIRDIRNSKRLPGVERIWMPGEQSHLRHAERARDGIPLSPPLAASLEALAAELGVAKLRPA